MSYSFTYTVRDVRFALDPDRERLDGRRSGFLRNTSRSNAVTLAFRKSGRYASDGPGGAADQQPSSRRSPKPLILAVPVEPRRSVVIRH
jgi:hypothetical protein